MVAAVLVLPAIIAPTSSAQRAARRCRPGDPCPAAYPGDDATEGVARWMARGSQCATCRRAAGDGRLAESACATCAIPVDPSSASRLHRSPMPAVPGFPKIPSCSAVVRRHRRGRSPAGHRRGRRVSANSEWIRAVDRDCERRRRRTVTATSPTSTMPMPCSTAPAGPTTTLPTPGPGLRVRAAAASATPSR